MTESQQLKDALDQADNIVKFHDPQNPDRYAMAIKAFEAIANVPILAQAYRSALAERDEAIKYGEVMELVAKESKADFEANKSESKVKVPKR